jgi:hypothetical protein
MARQNVMGLGGVLMGSGTIKIAPGLTTSMKRQSIALFLSTLALAGGTVACGKQPEGGEGGEQEPKQLTQPSSPAPAESGDSEGGEGGEGGEG